MMKLSSMQLVGSTVGTDGSCTTVEKILECWGFDQGSVNEVRFSTNFVFVFRQQGVKRFLRFSPAWERQVEHILAETELLKRLAHAGFQVAQPIASRNGTLVETVVTELGAFHAVVFSALSGQHLEMDDLTDSQFQAQGTALGRLHSACKAHGPNLLKRPSWREHLDFIRDHVPNDDALMLCAWETILKWAESLPQGVDDFGLIHFDFELDNLCWDGHEVQMLDFDDCSYWWYAADIAFALRDLFVDEQYVDYEDARFKGFVAGYRTECEIDNVWLGQLPMFLRLCKLYGYANLLYSIDLSIEETQIWLQPLHEKLSKWMETYRLSLNA